MPAPARCAQLNERDITRHLVQACDWRQLNETCTECVEGFNAIHVSAALVQVCARGVEGEGGAFNVASIHS